MTLKQQKQAALDKERNRVERYIRRFKTVEKYDAKSPEKIIKKAILYLKLIALIAATRTEYQIILSQPLPKQ